MSSTCVSSSDWLYRIFVVSITIIFQHSMGGFAKETGQNLEHRLAYFREDYGLSSFHWHWHLTYPSFGEIKITNKSRRGELFYYIHQQILARYNFERLCNNLSSTTSLNNWDAPIKDSYFPKLDLRVASRIWPGRPANLRMQDVVHGNTTITIDSLKLYRLRLVRAIRAGYAIAKDGQKIVLDTANGIDILGNMIESSVLSVNREFYGQLHNFGHRVLGHIHDPSGGQKENIGVIGDRATSIRDPIFYRWHTFINEMFREYLDNLPGYTEDELNIDGVTVNNVSICSTTGCDGTLYTYWETSLVNLTRGLDLQVHLPRLLLLTRLQHKPFTYKFGIISDKDREVTIRIFLSPKYDQNGNPWIFSEQKNIFIELDKFPVKLQQGINTIDHSFKDSSVIIPKERTYRDLDTHRPQKGEGLDEFIFCGCGWPANLLIPRGNSQTFPSQLFIMVSDASRDKVNQDAMSLCSDTHSYCGVLNSEYPDRKSMGFPFDRPPRVGVETLKDFVTPSMKVIDVFIKFLSNDTY